MLTGILERTVEEFGLPQRRPGFESQVGLVAALLIYTLVLKKTKKKGKINNECIMSFVHALSGMSGKCSSCSATH